MTIGIILLLITILGALSNYLNWKFLNYKVTKYLYYIGAFVHESSHALLCLFTGSKIEEFKVFSGTPHITHSKSKLGIIGQTLISSAPIFGGILFLYLVNYFLLDNSFSIIKQNNNIFEIIVLPFNILKSINLFSFSGITMILLLINTGAMIGPSPQDIKNAWPIFFLLLLLNYSPLNNFLFTALIIILTNIYIQIVLIVITKIFSKK